MPSSRVSSWLRDQTQAPAMKPQSLNHWTTREVLNYQLSKTLISSENWEASNYILSFTLASHRLANLKYYLYKLNMKKLRSFKIGKGVHQGCILLPCLFNLHAEYILWNAELDEAQAGIKIAEKNINNLRFADDTTLMAESEEELKSLLMKVKKESEKLNIQ